MKLQKNCWRSQRRQMFVVGSLVWFVVEVCGMTCVMSVNGNVKTCEESSIESHGRLRSAVGRIGGSW
jgi:hypothetical protein